MLQVSRFRSVFLFLGLSLLLGGILFLFSSPAHADSFTDDASSTAANPESVPTFVYETTIAEPGFEGGRDLVVDDAGNAYVVSRSYDTDNDVLITRIDPNGSVVWEKLLAGSGHDFGTGIVIDDHNDVFIVGTTHSSDFPVLNAYQPNYNGATDIFLTKLSGQDGSILFSTFFGGSRIDQGADVTLDSNGNLVITGYTDSTDFPTVNPIQPTLNLTYCFCEDAFVSRFSGDGQTLLFSTYLGGAKDDKGTGIAVDASDNIFFTGTTLSPDFPLANAVQATYGGEQDNFVTQIAGDDSGLVYSTYLGGAERDWATAVTADTTGHVYVTGSTRSINYPTTSGAYQETFVGGILDCGFPPYEPRRNCDDAFVTQLNPDGSWGYSTFLGGTHDDLARNLTIAENGHLFAIGHTQSTDFPGSGSGFDIFISQIDETGSSLLDTFLIPSPVANDGHGIALGSSGDIFIAGAQNVPADLYVARIEGPNTQPRLIASQIDLTVESNNDIHKLTGLVTVQDAAGQPVGDAKVSIYWTRADGTQVQQTGHTDANGTVSFRIHSRVNGWHTFTIEGIHKTGYLFDADQSITTASIAVGNGWQTNERP